MRRRKGKITNHLARLRQSFSRGRLSQAELARRVGVSRSYICKLEKGRLQPSARVMFEIAQELCCPVDEMFELKKPKK